MTTGEATQDGALRILELALTDFTARERRESALALDGRDEEAVRVAYEDLDEVVTLFRERLAEPADETPAIAPEDVAEIHTDDELHVASEIRASDAPDLLPEGPSRPVTGEKRPVRRRAGPLDPAEQARRAAELLYEDVLWLFSINDGEGALVSLERLLMLGRLEGEAAEFVRLNSEKLLNLYQGYMGPFNKTPRRTEQADHGMPPGYLALDALGKVYELVNGKRPITRIMKAVDLSPLETCAALEQLKRARLIEL